LADWNGMMIAALARAGAIFGEAEWIARGEQAFAFVSETMRDGERLGHSYRGGRLLLPGLASDYAWMMRAALALHEVTGKPYYLRQALAWQSVLDTHHADAETGGYYLTADDAAGLVIRPHATNDDAIENHNAVAAENLVRLAALTGDHAWRERADRLFDGMLPLAAGNLFGHAGLLNALDARLGMAEIIVTGDGEASRTLRAAARRLPFLRNALVPSTSVADLPETHPLRAKALAAPEGAAFVCVGERCSLPITDPEKLPAAAASSPGLLS
ncbi:MAG: thioredoxin domain-containing protein, partial [Rhizobiales bacterium]|nr:thioredoxin domain-containing protein [Hyphomicrobiales bacterium]